MTQLLEKAFAQAQQLPASEQDAIAAWLIEELADERRWDESFARSRHALARLAEEALTEHRAGQAVEIGC